MAGGHGPGKRGKVQVDFGDVSVQAAVGAEQIKYYSERAPWFDSVYENSGEYDRGPTRNAEWRAHIDRVLAAMANAGLRGDCVELGVGTGFWTERIAQLADRIWALDASPAMLDVARRRLEGAAAEVTYQVVDLWRWQPERQWDSAAAFFFIEHVPDEIIDGLLQRLHDALKPGSPFFVAEGAWYASEPNVEVRLIDGESFRVVERRRTVAEFEEIFDRAGFDVEFGATERLIDFTAIRR